MPTPTEGHSTDTDALVLDRAAHGYWVPGPNAQWRVAGSPTGDGKAFTRTHLASVIAAHHAALYGTEHGDDANADEFQNAGRGQFQTTFHKNLPGEVNRYLEGNPAARRLFHVTQDASAAGGADALGDLGEDKYFAHVDRLHGSRFNAALDTARNSPDPAMQYAAKVYDNLPETASALRSKATKAEKAGDHERAATLRKRAMDTREVQTVDAKRLNVGHQFTHGGIVHRVVEDADGHRVLASEHGEFPLESLDAVAVDAGSLRKGKVPKMVPDDIAPFSAAGAGGWLCNPFARALELSATKEKPPIIGWELGHPVYEVWSHGALSCGAHTHPVTHQNFTLTRDVLDTAATSLSRMLANGVDVPLVEDHQEKADKALGWVKGAKRVGDQLHVKHHVIGDDGLLKCARNKVSLKLVGNFRDSRNHTYPYAITHSSLTPVPVIHGQTGFSIAASGAQPANLADGVPSVPIYLLSAEPLPERSDNMPVSAELLNRFKSLPGTPEAKDDATAEEILALSLSYAEKAGNHLVTLAEEKAVLLSRAETAEASALELSRAEPKHADPYAHLDPEALADRADLTLSRIDLAIERGDMPKAIADRIKAKVKVADKPNAMLLSRSEHLEARPIDFILSLFDGAKLAPRTGEVTGTQILSRVTPGEAQTEDLPYKRMAERYNATAPAAK